MRQLVKPLVIAAFVLAVAAAGTALSWSSPAMTPQDIETAFQENEATSESAPQQQVSASWAIKDATLLTVLQLEAISTKLGTIALLLAAVVAACVAIALRGSAPGGDLAQESLAPAGVQTRDASADLPAPATATSCRFCGERSPAGDQICRSCHRPLMQDA